MPIQKFIIEYDNDKPLLPVNHFRFKIHSRHKKTNLETLKGVLTLITKSYEFIPLEDSDRLSHTTPKRKRTAIPIYLTGLGSSPSILNIDTERGNA